jgi:hypothetical protein
MSPFDALTSDDESKRQRPIGGPTLCWSEPIPDQGASLRLDSLEGSSDTSPAIHMNGSSQFDVDIQGLLRKASRGLSPASAESPPNEQRDDTERVTNMLLRMVSNPGSRTLLMSLKDEGAVDVLEAIQLVQTGFRPAHDAFCLPPLVVAGFDASLSSCTTYNTSHHGQTIRCQRPIPSLPLSR